MQFNTLGCSYDNCNDILQSQLWNVKSSSPRATYMHSWTGSGNGLAPAQCQAITWTNADLSSMGLLGTNFSEILIKIRHILLMKMHLKRFAKWQPFCPGENDLTNWCLMIHICISKRRGCLKNAYKLLNLRALKCSIMNRNCLFQCMGNTFCVEFQRSPLKFHTKYLTHTLKDV